MDGLKARLSFDAVAYDYDDEYLTIDTDTHIININNVSRLFGVQYDGNSKLIKFRIRNKLSDIQKMQDSIVYINWIDSKGVKGQSIAINKTISNDICEFAWKVPFDALKNSGVLHFAMSAVITENNSSVINQKWSTQIAAVTTPDGIYIKSYTPSSEEEDRIAQIYNELSKMINTQSENLQSQVNSLKEDINNAKSGKRLLHSLYVNNKSIGSQGEVVDVDGYQYTKKPILLSKYEQIRLVKNVGASKSDIYRIKVYYENPYIGKSVPDYQPQNALNFYEATRDCYVVICNEVSTAGSSPTIEITSNDVRFEKITEELDNIKENASCIKYASRFGFNPNNNAHDNSIALQSALNGGGTIIVDIPGRYYFSKTHVIEPNTTLIFGANTILDRQCDDDGNCPTYPFINKNASANNLNNLDENITIKNLTLSVHSNNMGNDIERIYGLQGYLAFANVKNLVIDGFTMLDGGNNCYAIHIQGFENISLKNIHIESQKDGIHLGKGKGFVIKHCKFKTNDDAIALNAHDYPSCTKYLGWIENGIVEDIHFLSAPNFNKGRGIYMLGGSWVDWYSGMKVREYGDTVVSFGKIYRTKSTVALPSRPTITSTVRPEHTSGTVTYSDGVTWEFVQDVAIGYNAFVKNVRFKDIYFDRETNGAITFNFDDDLYSRSYYPDPTTLSTFENIIIENLVTNENVDHAIYANSPIDSIKLVNSFCNTQKSVIKLENVQDLNSNKANILLSGDTFNFSTDDNKVIADVTNRNCELVIVGSLTKGDKIPTTSGSVTIRGDFG